MKSNLKNLLKKHFASLAFFYTYLRYRLVLLFLLSMIVGLMDGLGLTMFIPLLETVADGSGNASQSLGKLGFVVNIIEGMGLEMVIEVILLAIFFFFAMKGIAYFIEQYLVTVYQQYFVKRLRVESIDALSNYSFQYFVNADAGRIQNFFSGEVARVVQAYRQYSSMMQQLMLLLVYVTLAVLANFEFALMVALGAWLTNVFFKVLYKKTKVLSHRLVNSNHGFQGLLIQMVAFFKYLKATGSILEYRKYLKDKVLAIEDDQRRIGILNSIMVGIREPLIIGIVVIVILIQVKLLGGLLSAIILSLLLLYRGLGSVMQIQRNYNQFLAFSGSLTKLQEFLNELRTGSGRKGDQIFPGIQKQMAIKDLAFSYGRIPILKDINFTLYKNETLALVGKSGSGKTTLMNLLSGLLVPDSGKIEIDGQDLSNLNLNTYQQKIGYITQEPVIFDDTVFNNVTFWDIKTPENLDRFREALEKASIREFIINHPLRENTRLGNNGINLSGGQKQRICIARELYKEVEFLFMDEATSSLDSETEKAIQQNIEQLKGKYTILIIAHRLSTIKHADRVVVLQNGQIEHIGLYDQLFKESPEFKRMVELQELSLTE